MSNKNKINFAFFGGEPLAVPTLTILKEAGFLPTLIICNPDRPVGRKQILTPPPTKVWATENNIPVLQPEKMDETIIDELRTKNFELFIVVAYNKIMPKKLLDLPSKGTLNVHPSLLPKLRGASPIRSAILEDMRETGVTIMLMDEKMDHGPIIQQEITMIEKDAWPLPGRTLDALLAKQGAELLVKTLPEWIDGKIEAKPQEESTATFCKKISREMGEISLTDDPYKNYLKFCAFDGWPGIFYFDDVKKRVKITDAEFKDGKFVIKKIVREGEKESTY